MIKTILLWVGSICMMIFFLTGVCYAQISDQEMILEKKKTSHAAIDDFNYIIGAEDVLYVHVWKEQDLSVTTTVRMDGKISLPLIDDVMAAGLTTLQLKQILIKKFKEFVDIPNVSVIVMESNSYKVFISGQVLNPGMYRLKDKTSVIQIIPMAGGFTKWADRKKIIVIRKDKETEQRFVINYNKIISGKDLSLNITLKPGDTVIVP